VIQLGTPRVNPLLVPNVNNLVDVAVTQKRTRLTPQSALALYFDSSYLHTVLRHPAESSGGLKLDNLLPFYLNAHLAKPSLDCDMVLELNLARSILKLQVVLTWHRYRYNPL
jgi:hypothetical protein